MLVVDLEWNVTMSQEKSTKQIYNGINKLTENYEDKYLVNNGHLFIPSQKECIF